MKSLPFAFVIASLAAGLPTGCNRDPANSASVAKPAERQTITQIAVKHVRLTTEKPFDAVSADLVAQLGIYDAGVAREVLAAGDIAAARARLSAMAGPSGFMLFEQRDHGALLGLVGRSRKAMQYSVGNPLIALEMTQHCIAAGLYAPLRVFLYEAEDGTTCIEYDRPSSSFGQFGNASVDSTASDLDRKLEALVLAATR